MLNRFPARAWTSACSLVTLLCGLLTATELRAEEYYQRYDLSLKPSHVTLAVQPTAYPLAFISSTMLRDRLLKSDLHKHGLTLRSFAFRKGNDIVQVSTPEAFQMAFLGDMPTVNLSQRFPLAIAGLGKRNFSSVVARNFGRLEELRGRKIGYSAGSSSHLVLLRGLLAAKMSEKDVQLVPLEPAQMPDSLEDGRVDAFSAWEPTPAISLARNPMNRAIYKGMSTDWVVLPMQVTQQQPEVALALTASFARAINWMRRSGNIETAAQWVFADGAAFTGEAPKLPLARAIEIARQDLLDVPGAPATPSMVDGAPPLSREFSFLREQGRISASASEAPLRQAFAYKGLATVMSDPKRYRLFSFDYER